LNRVYMHHLASLILPFDQTHMLLLPTGGLGDRSSTNSGAPSRS
jgi:hypothetical protein